MMVILAVFGTGLFVFYGLIISMLMCCTIKRAIRSGQGYWWSACRSDTRSK